MSACNSFSSASVSMGAGAAPDVLMRFLAPRTAELNCRPLLLGCRLGSRLLFPRLDFCLEARGCQQLAHVEQHDETPANFPQPGDAIQSAFLEHCRRSF